MSQKSRIKKTIITTTIERVDTDGKIYRETKTEEQIHATDDDDIGIDKDIEATPPPTAWPRLNKSHDFHPHTIYPVDYGGDHLTPRKSVDKVTEDTSKLSVSNRKPESLNHFRTEMLNLHNQYRQKHGVPNLALSEKLNSYAQEWAEKLAQSGRFEHRKDNKYGENIFYGRRTGGMTAADAASSWYNEIKRCNFSGENNFMTCGHFTQMVWKNSKELGVGWVQKDDGTTYVVGNYDPPGNVIGYYHENVFTPL